MFNTRKSRANNLANSVDVQSYLDKVFHYCLPMDAEITLSKVERSKVYNKHTVVFDVEFAPISETELVVLLSKAMTKEKVRYDFLEIRIDGMHIGIVFHVNNPTVEAPWIHKSNNPATDKIEICFYVD